MPRPELEGPVAEFRLPDADIGQLRREKATLQRRIDDLELDLQKEKNKAKRAEIALANLRDSPLAQVHRALKWVFNELDGLDLPESPAPTAPGAPVAPTATPSKWDAIKNRVGGRQAQIIGLLQDVGAATTNQMAAALKSDPRTIQKNVAWLKAAGLVKQHGNNYNLA